MLVQESPVRMFRAPRRHDGGTVTAGRPDPAYRAYQLLYFAFVVAPIVAGVDKFFNFLVDWHKYLAPWLASLTGGGVGFMKLIGVVEICAGVLVGLSPRLGGWIVAAWLWGIIVNLLTYPGYLDIALRDFGLSLGALALSQLASEYGIEEEPLSLQQREREMLSTR